MSRFSLAILLVVATLVVNRSIADASDDSILPNVVIIFTDDQGYGDLSCFGNPTIHTPRLDRMAAEGMKLTQFYVASPVCSPSRAALLTGCYPKRVGMHKHVVFPPYDYGLHSQEVTIADMLRPLGYATGCFGKWHLGHRAGLMPTDQGFDEYFGVPYSNDMSVFHRKPGHNYKFSLPLIRGKKVVEWEPDQHLLTKMLTEAAVEFIDANHERPFFLYVPHPMPHIPIYASDQFEGASARGLYGDVIEEIDWSVGQILDRLAAHGLDDNTLVIFTTDNGPWKPFKENGGSAGPLRGAKGTNWEGGQRVPCIVRWPERVPAGSVCRTMTRSIDLLPTIAEFTGADLPEAKIDGSSIANLLQGNASDQPADKTFVYYSARGELTGIRRGQWKLLFAGAEAKGGPQLFNVNTDISEEWNKARQRPELVDELRELAQSIDEQMSTEARPVQKVSETLWEWPAGDDSASE